MLVTNTITMAIDRQQMPPVIDAVQGEANSRAIKIQLTMGGKPWNVPSDVSCFVRFGKPDKTGGIYDTLEDGTSAVEIGDNYLQFLLVEQVISFPGDVFVQVEMTKNGASLSTFSVVVRVQEDNSIGAFESKDYYNLRKYVYEEIKNFFDDDTPTTAMTVTFSGNANSGYKADKTFAEIGNALSAGTTVVGVLRSAALDIVLDNVLLESEQSYCSFNGQVRRYAGGEAIPIESWTAILHFGNTVEVFSEDIVTAETVGNYLPSKLPNPNALTINGQIYDGSQAVEVNIEGGSKEVAVSTEKPTDESVVLWVDPNEEPEETGIDVVAEVGQTIVVEEVDGSGKPTKWKAADYQPRTHYPKDGAIILPETTCEVSDGMADAIFNAPLVKGKTYRVTFDGQQYYTTAKQAEGGVYIGNGLFAGGSEVDTGEPFAILYGAIDETAYCLIVLADADATQCTASIVEIDFVTIPTEYLPSTHQRYIVNVPEGEVDTSSTIWELSENSDNVAPIIYGGGDVLLKIVDISGAVSFYQLLSPTIAAGAVTGFVAKAGRTLSSVIFTLGTWTPPTT